MNRFDFQADGALTNAQLELIGRLTDAQLQSIDGALLANTGSHWRKVARVVGAVMLELPDRIEGIPDVYYAERIKLLVAEGKLVAQGDLSCMRASEIKQPGNAL